MNIRTDLRLDTQYNDRTAFYEDFRGIAGIQLPAWGTASFTVVWIKPNRRAAKR